jgi:hypothetical protein
MSVSDSGGEVDVEVGFLLLLIMVRSSSMAIGLVQHDRTPTPI